VGQNGTTLTLDAQIDTIDICHFVPRFFQLIFQRKYFMLGQLDNIFNKVSTTPFQGTI
jgi:hypothetical protein